MPRAVRKSVSRCSTRSSSRSSCRKRDSPKDNALSSIRKALRSSSIANRYVPPRRETPTPTPMPPKTQSTAPVSTSPEVAAPRVEQAIALPRPTESTATNAASPKPMGLFQHGIRYIMLPLHLFHLCVWGSPTAATSEVKDTKTSAPETRKTDDKPSSRPESQHSTTPATSSRSSSSSASSSGFSSSSSTSSRSSATPSSRVPTSSASSRDAQPIASVSSSVRSSGSSSASSSSSSSSSPSSSANRRTSVPRRILREETTDYSSDEMVTAAEDHDDSSNDQWSNAVSSPSMNMSVDLDGSTTLEKVSGNIARSFLTTEEPMDVWPMEPMDVATEESILKSPSRNFRALKLTAERRPGSSSSSAEDRRSLYQEYSDSSVDREIASVFRRAAACASSSDDDDDCVRRTGGRRHNPLFDRSSFGPVRPGSRFREEISDAAIRRKRTTGQDDGCSETPVKRSNRVDSSGSRSIPERPFDLSKVIGESKTTNHQTDSAYSDEDVEMNPIDESTTRSPSTSNPRTIRDISVVEWMDQDLEYVADSEDTNDGSPPFRRSGVPSSGAVSATSVDQGFAERDLGTPLGEWRQISGLERSTLGRIVGPQVDEYSRGDWKVQPEKSGPERSTTDGDHRVVMKVSGTTTADWSNISGLDVSVEGHRVPATRAADADPVDRQTNCKIEVTLGDWNNISGLDGSVEGHRVPTPRKADVDPVERTMNRDVRVAGRGPPGFPEAPQHPAATSCHCGNPGCFYVPLAVPADGTAVNWTANYPKAPSPLRHLYYDYPEFMSPPAEAKSRGHGSPYVLVPVPANLMVQELA